MILVWALVVATCAGAELLEDVRFSDPEPPQSGLEGVERLRFELPEAEGIVVDGVLDEPVWSDPAAHLGKFRLGLSTVPARHTREAWAAWDAEYLYLAVRLQRKPGTELRVNTRENDNAEIWEDDEIEVFLDPYNTGTEYFQLIINSEGFLFDARHSLTLVPDPRAAGPGEMMLKRTSDVSWSSHLERAIAIEEEWWTAELGVSLKALGLEGAPAGHSIGFNITSADWDTNEYTCLSPTSNWHDPLQFGVAVLGEPRVEVTDLTLGQVGAGNNTLRARVRDLSGEGGSFSLSLTFIATRGGTSTGTPFDLPAGGEVPVRVPFVCTGAPAGDDRWRAEVQITDVQGPVFAARRVGTFLEPLTLTLGSGAVFTDGRPVPVAARLGLGSGTARGVELTARLTDETGRAVAEQDLGRPRGAIISAWLPVAGLAPGSYTVALSAKYRDQVVARATDTLRVAASPWASQ